MAIPEITKAIVWLPEERTEPLDRVTTGMLRLVEEETKEKLYTRWLKEGAIDTALTIPFAALSLVTGLISAGSAFAGGPLGWPIAFPAGAGCAASSVKVYAIWDKHNVALAYVPKEIDTLRQEYTYDHEYKNISFEDAEKVAEWIFETAWDIHQSCKVAFQWSFDHAKDHYMGHVQVHKEIIALRKKYKITYDVASSAHRAIRQLMAQYLQSHPSSKKEEALNYAETHYFNIAQNDVLYAIDRLRAYEKAILKEQYRRAFPGATEQQAEEYAIEHLKLIADK